MSLDAEAVGDDIRRPAEKCSQPHLVIFMRLNVGAMVKVIQTAVTLWIALTLAACDNKPTHYLAQCDDKNEQDWKLVDFAKENGYFVSCTYQSPDGRFAYTSRCDKSGCGIK